MAVLRWETLLDLAVVVQLVRRQAKKDLTVAAWENHRNEKRKQAQQ
jgi:hypothetical protein